MSGFQNFVQLGCLGALALTGINIAGCASAHQTPNGPGRATKTLLFMLVTVLSFISGCSTLPPAQKATTPAASHSYVLSGTGSPTVVLEAGLGDGKDTWQPVYNQIAQTTEVFAYDRAGYGASRSSNRSRDGATIVRELRSTLHALDLEPPYILVGHSVGGTYMELYARTYPDEVAGVVLVDSRHADFTRQCQIAKARSCTPPAVLTALLPRAPRQELSAAEATMEAVIHGGPFPDVPLAVLTAGKQSQSGARFYATWLDSQNSLAALSADSTHQVCDRCGHYIHKDNPELVVAAVETVVRKSRDHQFGANR